MKHVAETGNDCPTQPQPNAATTKQNKSDVHTFIASTLGKEMPVVFRQKTHTSHLTRKKEIHNRFPWQQKDGTKLK